jgi:hypothetical protein
MTLVREPGSEILVQFIPPTRGTWLNTAINTVPPDAVYNSNNVFIREGKLRTRPALLQTLAVIPYNAGYSRHILGGISASLGSIGRLIYAVSSNRLFTFDSAGSSWTPFTLSSSPAQFTSSNEEYVDIAFLETSGNFVTVFANREYPLKEWYIGLATVRTITGTNIPTARSVCIAASRVIALVDAHTVVWSRVLNHTNFDALAIVKRAQTADQGVCVRSLSALSFVLYKENSIHLARAQAGLDEGTAFAFSEPIIAEGPAGPYAVTDVNGIHIYMTKSGRIGLFDGTAYPQWIADGIWFFLQNDINQDYAYLIRGVYDYRLNTVFFFYPKANETTSMTGMVIINLPFSGFEAQEGIKPYCFLGTCGQAVTHTNTKRFADEINRALVYTTPVSTSSTIFNHHLSESTTLDADAVFNCSFQTGLHPLPDARHMQITVETFVERGASYGALTIEAVTSHSLETAAGTIASLEEQFIDLNNTTVNEYIGFNKLTRFIGLKYSWNSTINVKYSGAVLYSSGTHRGSR